MNFLDLVKKRYSCRKYDSARPVSDEVISRCLEAARLAPSACNSQPWKFIVVKTPKLKEELVSKAFTGIYKMNTFANDASVLVVVVRESSKFVAQLGAFFRGIRFSLIDSAIATEHFVLQAAEDGVGTCWLGWFNERAVKKMFKIPRGKRVDTILSMGYPAEDVDCEKIRKSLDEISQVL
ncbi:MAG: nitroreductase family protein [Candidatus Zapsychrus exili]|nr:nitroreductase family protein [Candidatus Zapsychrus exili]